MRFDLRIDRELSVPVTAQLRGQLEYGIAFGDLAAGEQLPSVRDLAEQLGLAPVTVSQVYRDLQAKGLLETQVGRGTFVRRDASRSPRPDAQSRTVDVLAHRLARAAREIGVAPSELAQIIAIRLAWLDETARLQLVFVGNFEAATQRYVHALGGYLQPGDRLAPVVLPSLRGGSEPLERARRADAVLTLAYRAPKVRELLGPDVPIITVPFLPSTGTRQRLAELDPLERVGLVSTYEDYLVTFRSVVETYAPHVEVHRATVVGHDDVAAVARACDVIVYGTGADAVLDLLPATARAFEFQFSPDIRGVLGEVLPRLDRLRDAAALPDAPTERTAAPP